MAKIKCRKGIQASDIVTPGQTTRGFSYYGKLLPRRLAASTNTTRTTREFLTRVQRDRVMTAPVPGTEEREHITVRFLYDAGSGAGQPLRNSAEKHSEGNSKELKRWEMPRSPPVPGQASACSTPQCPPREPPKHKTNQQNIYVYQFIRRKVNNGVREEQQTHDM